MNLSNNLNVTALVEFTGMSFEELDKLTLRSSTIVKIDSNTRELEYIDDTELEDIKIYSPILDMEGSYIDQEHLVYSSVRECTINIKDESEDTLELWDSVVYCKSEDGGFEVFQVNGKDEYIATSIMLDTNNLQEYIRALKELGEGVWKDEEVAEQLATRYMLF